MTKMRVSPESMKNGLHQTDEARLTESEGFEPSRRLRDLPHFESLAPKNTPASVK